MNPVTFSVCAVVALMCACYTSGVTPVSAMRLRKNSIQFGNELSGSVNAELTYSGDRTVTMNDGGKFNATIVQADSVAAASSLLVGGLPVLRHVRALQSSPDYQPKHCCVVDAGNAVPGVEVTFTPVEGRAYMVSSTCRFTTESTTNNDSGPQNYITMMLTIDSYNESGNGRASFNWANAHVDDLSGADYTTGRISGVAMASDLGAPGVPHTYRLVLFKGQPHDLFAQYCDLSFTEFPFSPLT